MTNSAEKSADCHCENKVLQRRYGTGVMEAKLIFAVLLLFSVCNRGNAQHCRLSDLAVTQTILPGKVRGLTQYTATVANRCICSQADIKVACRGFTSSMGVDPAILRPDGDGKLCTVNDGRPVGMGPNYAVKFHYASSSQIGFKPVSSTIACS